MKNRLEGILSSPHPVRLATGFKFTEGPVWDPEGGWLFVDLRANRIYRLVPGDPVVVVRENSAASNGMTWDIEGRLLICEGGARRIARCEADGSYSCVADRVDGRRFNRPNDLVTRSDGSIYFTDPGGSRAPVEGRELDFYGVHMIRPDGKVVTVTKETEYPNGLAFSPDEGILYVAITRKDLGCLDEKSRGEVCKHQFIRAFDVNPDGSLGNNRIFAPMHSSEDGVPDGMKVDIEGRVFCTGPGGCWVFEPSGELIGLIRLPEIPANCAWGGDDYRTMLFTARTSVYALDMRCPGTRPPRCA